MFLQTTLFLSHLYSKWLHLQTELFISRTISKRQTFTSIFSIYSMIKIFNLLFLYVNYTCIINPVFPFISDSLSTHCGFPHLVQNIISSLIAVPQYPQYFILFLLSTYYWHIYVNIVVFRPLKYIV